MNDALASLLEHAETLGMAEGDYLRLANELKTVHSKMTANRNTLRWTNVNNTPLRFIFSPTRSLTITQFRYEDHITDAQFRQNYPNYNGDNSQWWFTFDDNGRVSHTHKKFAGSVTNNGVGEMASLLAKFFERIGSPIFTVQDKYITEEVNMYEFIRKQFKHRKMMEGLRSELADDDEEIFDDIVMLSDIETAYKCFLWHILAMYSNDYTRVFNY